MDSQNDTSPIKHLRAFSDTLEDFIKAREEAKGIIKNAVEKKENLNCYIYVDINGSVFRYGNYPTPDIEKDNIRTAASVLVYTASVDRNPIYEETSGSDRKFRQTGEFTYEFYSRYGSEFENVSNDYDLKNTLSRWIKKNREKVHHVSLPMSKRIKLRKEFIDERLAKVEQAIILDGFYPAQLLKDALSSIDEIMNHMRFLKKEFTLQAEKDIPYFKSSKKR